MRRHIIGGMTEFTSDRHAVCQWRNPARPGAMHHDACPKWLSEKWHIAGSRKMAHLRLAHIEEATPTAS